LRIIAIAERQIYVNQAGGCQAADDGLLFQQSHFVTATGSRQCRGYTCDTGTYYGNIIFYRTHSTKPVYK
jgi:hypothetical protein